MAYTDVVLGMFVLAIALLTVVLALVIEKTIEILKDLFFG